MMKKQKANQSSDLLSSLARPLEYVPPKPHSMAERVFLLRGVECDPRFEGLRWRDCIRRMQSIFENVQKRHLSLATVKRRWKAPKCEGRVAEWNDFPVVGSYFQAFSERAMAGLRGIVGEQGVWLPVKCGLRYYFVLVPMCQSDVLDQLNSVVSYTLRYKRWSGRHFERYAFHSVALLDRPVFSIPDVLFRTFVTNAFVEKVRSLGLIGLSVDIVYPLKKSERWEAVATRAKKFHLAFGLPKGQSVSGAAVSVRFILDNPNKIPTRTQELMVRHWAGKVDRELWDFCSMAVPVGYLFAVRPDTGFCTAIFRGPDREKLRQRLRPFLSSSGWLGAIRLGREEI
jgi:hypothetical protein